MRMSHLCVLIFSALSSLPTRAHADEAVLLVKSNEVLSVWPKVSEETLVGKSVWIGNHQGARGSATLQLEPHRKHDVVLDQAGGGGLFLGYTSSAQFAPLSAQSISSGPVLDLVVNKLVEVGAANPRGIDVAELADIDLDADGRADRIVSVHNKRKGDATSSGKPGDVEALFLIVERDGQFQIIDQIMDVQSSDPAQPDLPWINLLALAKNPVTRNWNLLVSEEHRKWENADTTMQVTIGGQTTQQTTAEPFLYQSWKVSLYELKGGKLSSILRQWLLSI